MNLPSTEFLARACRIFMELAYPEGPATVPAKKQVYCSLPCDRPITDFLPPAAGAEPVCQAIPAGTGGIRGYAFRLGCAHYPNLKLNLQQTESDGDKTWVVMVDTHDAFTRKKYRPPDDHPDAAEWLKKQAMNRNLKEEIEAAWEKAGLPTFASMLRRDLEKPES